METHGSTPAHPRSVTSVRSSKTARSFDPEREPAKTARSFDPDREPDDFSDLAPERPSENEELTPLIDMRLSAMSSTIHELHTGQGTMWNSLSRMSTGQSEMSSDIHELRTGQNAMLTMLDKNSAGQTETLDVLDSIRRQIQELSTVGCCKCAGAAANTDVHHREVGLHDQYKDKAHDGIADEGGGGRFRGGPDGGVEAEDEIGEGVTSPSLRNPTQYVSAIFDAYQQMHKTDLFDRGDPISQTINKLEDICYDFVTGCWEDGDENIAKYHTHMYDEVNKLLGLKPNMGQVAIFSGVEMYMARLIRMAENGNNENGATTEMKTSFIRKKIMSVIMTVLHPPGAELDVIDEDKPPAGLSPESV
mgnify:CR=1 FL=1